MRLELKARKAPRVRQAHSDLGKFLPAVAVEATVVKVGKVPQEVRGALAEEVEMAGLSCFRSVRGLRKA
ncbi:MAG: hypothetical protein ACREMY_27535 [bacterium]